MTDVTDTSSGIHDASVGDAGVSRQEHDTNEKMIGKWIPFQDLKDLDEWKERYEGHIERKGNEQYFVIDYPKEKMRA